MFHLKVAKGYLLLGLPFLDSFISRGGCECQYEHVLLISYSFSRADTPGLPGGKQGSQEGGQEGYTDNEA